MSCDVELMKAVSNYERAWKRLVRAAAACVVDDLQQAGVEFDRLWFRVDGDVVDAELSPNVPDWRVDVETCIRSVALVLRDAGLDSFEVQID